MNKSIYDETMTTDGDKPPFWIIWIRIYILFFEVSDDCREYGDLPFQRLWLGIRKENGIVIDIPVDAWAITNAYYLSITDSNNKKWIRCWWSMKRNFVVYIWMDNPVSSAIAKARISSKNLVERERKKKVFVSITRNKSVY